MFDGIRNFLADRWVSPYKGKNDNRNYRYSSDSFARREEFDIISKWIKRGDKVIDLGCGDGSLLKILTKKGAVVEGMEISRTGIESCKKKGLKVKLGRIDRKLPYGNKEFDVAICNVTIQMVMYPEVLLKEMKRISKKQIVTFPNFAFLPNRIDLLLNGRMPQVMIPGYRWYSTGHIHQLSISDFERLAKEIDLRVVSTKHIYPGSSFALTRGLSVGTKWMKARPNLFASMAVFLTNS